jgi:2-keto-4-pentenoate hydratase/2-oxohepta-3-ene-1,7-dioic acid hydratase in catechol pathway
VKVLRVAKIRRRSQLGIAVPTEGGLRAVFGDAALYDLDEVVRSGIGAVSNIHRRCLDSGVFIGEEEVTYLPPLSRSSKILCVGLNYRDHAEETGFVAPEYPTIFARFASGLVGHNAPLIKPRISDDFDFEGEMAIVIGKSGHEISTEDALSHVGAYSIFNDGSVRDYQLRTTQWTVGKNFDGTGAFGPWLVSPEALPPGATGLQLTTRLNGEVVQSASTADMVFGVAELISILSTAMTLEAGDVIVSGTPAGIGMTRTPPLYMRDGDICEVEIESVGCLRNPICRGQ